MVKQAVKVVIRSRPTDNFASTNMKIEPKSGVNFEKVIWFRTFKSTLTKRKPEQ